MSRLVVLDESKHRRHGILSVGGVIIDLEDLATIEESWNDAKQVAGLSPETAVKYSMNWPNGPDQRTQLIEAAGSLPLQAVVALLEDFRPRGMKARKATRKDAYIQVRAFDWVLQRLGGELYIPATEPGSHLVTIDGRDDFQEFQKIYARGYETGWPSLPHHPVGSLKSRGFSASLGECSNGPVHEIADLLTSCVTRWADERCMVHKDGKAPDLRELNECMSHLIDLFPIGSPGVPPRRCGYSFIVHTGNRTGKELLSSQLDHWAHELKSLHTGNNDEIPF